MDFYDERLNRRTKDDEFRKAWGDSEEQYEKDRELILLERIARLEKDPDSSVAWEDIKRGS